MNLSESSLQKAMLLFFDFLITQYIQIVNAKEEYFKKQYHDALEENKSGLIFYYHNCFKADVTDLKNQSRIDGT